MEYFRFFALLLVIAVTVTVALPAGEDQLSTRKKSGVIPAPAQGNVEPDSEPGSEDEKTRDKRFFLGLGALRYGYGGYGYRPFGYGGGYGYGPYGGGYGRFGPWGYGGYGGYPGYGYGGWW